MQRQKAITSLKNIAWVVLVIILIMSVASMVEKKKTAKMLEVSVNIKSLPDGNDLITKGDVFQLLDRSFGYSMEGIAQSEVNIERIESVLGKDPFVLRAEAFLTANNKVAIELEQRIPIMRIIDKMELSYYLDESGNKLPLSKHFTARVLVASGNIPPHIPDFMDKKGHLLNQIYVLGNKIIADDLFAPLIEQIFVTQKNEFVLIPKLGNQKILLGQYRNIEEKLENLKIFYKNAIAQKGWQKYKTYDLRYNGQVIAEKK